MKAIVKLGCLQSDEALPTPFHLGGSVRKRLQTFACQRLDVPLPTEGAEESPLSCPICSRALLLKARSLARVYFKVQWGILAAALTCLLLAVGLFLAPADGGKNPLPIIGAIIGVLGLAGLAAAYFCESLPASLFKSEFVSIREDASRHVPQYGDDIVPRGHRILEVRLASSAVIPS